MPCSTTNTVREAVALILIDDKVWWIVWVEVWIVNGVVCTSGPFALEIRLLHYFIIVWHQLVICGICRRHYNLSPAWVSSDKALLKTCLTSSSNRRLSSRVFIVILLLVALIGDRVCHWVYFVVGKLVLVWNLNCPLVVQKREHAVLKTWSHKLDDVFLDSIMKHNVKHVISKPDACKGSKSFQTKISYLLFLVVE